MSRHKRFLRSIRFLIAAFLCFCSFATGLAAQTAFVCPQNCKIGQGRSPDGSSKYPWPSLMRALEEIRKTGADEILLLGGQYGQMTIANQSFAKPITIKPASGAKAHFEMIHITDSENIILSDLNVWPLKESANNRPLVRTTRTAKKITFQGMELRGHKTAQAYMGWSKDTWLKYSVTGIEARGPDVTIANNHFWGTGVPIVTIGLQAKVFGNVIKGFSGDGMVGLGDHSVFAGNRVQDCVKIHDNHDDGFQSWSLPPGQGVITGLVLERNMFLEWTGRKSHPLRCTLQGIGLFDGTYKDLVIRNNLVAVSSYHGISVYGGDNVTITHNTVVNVFGDNKDFPWILVSPHKDGTPSRNMVLGNNLAMSYNLLPPLKAQFSPLVNSNLQIRYPFGVFKNPKTFDFRLKPTSSANGAGRPKFSASPDIMGRVRPKGQNPDVGAYQSE